MRIRASAVLASAIGLLLFAGSASALSYHTGNSIPDLGSAEVVGYDLYGSSSSSYAVAFEATLDGVLGVSFCGDLLHSIGLNGSYLRDALKAGNGTVEMRMSEVLMPMRMDGNEGRVAVVMPMRF